MEVRINLSLYCESLILITDYWLFGAKHNSVDVNHAMFCFTVTTVKKIVILICLAVGLLSLLLFPVAR